MFEANVWGVILHVLIIIKEIQNGSHKGSHLFSYYLIRPLPIYIIIYLSQLFS
jgi:hypothetical protein